MGFAAFVGFVRKDLRPTSICFELNGEHSWMDPSLFQNKLFNRTFNIPHIIGLQCNCVPYPSSLIYKYRNSGTAEVHTRYQSAIMQSCSTAWCETAGIYCKQTYWMMTSQRALSMRVRSFPQKKITKKNFQFFWPVFFAKVEARFSGRHGQSSPTAALPLGSQHL